MHLGLLSGGLKETYGWNSQMLRSLHGHVHLTNASQGVKIPDESALLCGFGNPMQKAFGSFMTASRKFTPSPESQPMSPGELAEPLRSLPRQLANLGAPNKVLFK